MDLKEGEQEMSRGKVKGREYITHLVTDQQHWAYSTSNC